jgi:hypothetical protein
LTASCGVLILKSETLSVSLLGKWHIEKLEIASLLENISENSCTCFTYPLPLYACHSLVTASVIPTSFVSKEYRAMPRVTVPMRRAHMEMVRTMGTRALGK